MRRWVVILIAAANCFGWAEAGLDSPLEIASRNGSIVLTAGVSWFRTALLSRLGDALKPPVRIEIAKNAPAHAAMEKYPKLARAFVFDYAIASLTGGAVILTLLSASWLAVQQGRLSKRVRELELSLSEGMKGFDRTDLSFITLRGQIDLLESELSRIF